MTEILLAKGNGEQQVKQKNLKPILPIHDFEDVLIQLRPNLQCRTCYGRGYTSFTHDLKTGANTMNLCGCASFGETEIMKALRATGVLAQQIDHMASTFAEIMIRIERAQIDQGELQKAIMGRLLQPTRFRTFISGFKRKVIPNAIQVESPTA